MRLEATTLSTRSSSRGALSKMNARFNMVRRQIQLMEAMTSDGEDEAMNALNLKLEAFRADLFGELDDISRIAIQTPAQNSAELESKARMFLDYCMPEDGDMAHQLGKSICLDILKKFSRY